jgi:hypothetical protein
LVKKPPPLFILEDYKTKRLLYCSFASFNMENSRINVENTRISTNSAENLRLLMLMRRNDGLSKIEEILKNLKPCIFIHESSFSTPDIYDILKFTNKKIIDSDCAAEEYFTIMTKIEPIPLQDFPGYLIREFQENRWTTKGFSFSAERADKKAKRIAMDRAYEIALKAGLPLLQDVVPKFEYA